MPGDTLYFNAKGEQIPFDSLSPDMKASIKEVWHTNNLRRDGAGRTNQYILAIGVVLVVSFIMVMLPKLINRFKPPRFTLRHLLNSNDQRPATAVQQNEYYVYQGNKLGLREEEITAIIIKHYPFYNSLWPTVQYRFQQRLYNFIRSKSFIIYSQQPYKEMPVLTCAAAIHLTLGLNDYMLPWFKYICIHPEVYFAEDSLRILAGKVEGNTISVAWDKLLEGINNEADGSNVGLHEMAHALYYQEAIVNNNREHNFSANFEKVMQEGENIYKLKDTPHLLYSDYAYRNLQEFWAESVEIFFEKPEEMQRCYPEIYETIKELLKQDPVNRGNPLL